MGKAVFALVVSTAVIAGSFWLWRNREALFRPDIRSSGGTRLVLAVKGDAEGAAKALSRRLGAGRLGAVAVSAEDGQVLIDVPAGGRHDALLERAERLASRPGRLWMGILAEPSDDAEAAGAALTPAAREAAARGKLPVAPEGEFAGKGLATGRHSYAWAAIGSDQAARQGMVVPAHPGAAIAMPAPPLAVPGGPMGSDGSVRLVHADPVTKRETWFFLVRKCHPSGDLGNGDVTQVIESPLGRSPVVQLRIALGPDGRTRKTDLARRNIVSTGPPRRLALMIDGEILLWNLLATVPEPGWFMPVMESEQHASDSAALLRHPFPLGTTAEVAEKRTIPPR